MMLQRLRSQKLDRHGGTRLPAIAVAMLTLAATLLSASPAHASSHEGFLRIKGAGSTYTRSGFISVSGAPGAKVTFGIQVVNGPSGPAQFRVNVVRLPNTSMSAYAPLTGSKYLMDSVYGYYTTELAEGASETLTATTTLPVHVGDRQDKGALDFEVDLYATDGTLLGRSVLSAYQSVAEGDTNRVSMTATANGQKPLGGYYDRQEMSAQPVAWNGGAATFNVTIKNPTASVQNRYLRANGWSIGCDTWRVAVKSGLTDVSDEVKYSRLLVHLKAGASQTYKFTVTSTKADCLAHVVPVELQTYDGSFINHVGLRASLKDPR